MSNVFMYVLNERSRDKKISPLNSVSHWSIFIIPHVKNHNGVTNFLSQCYMLISTIQLSDKLNSFHSKISIQDVDKLTFKSFHSKFSTKNLVTTYKRDPMASN